jgi:DNA-binding NtrC family response regulator
MMVTLVIIDDNTGSLELLSTALAQDGLEIFCASDPEEGLDLVFEKHPEIVITDLVMPKLSGMEVLERIMDFDPAIEVILITAHYSSESAVEAIQKGAADYLDKPVSLDGIRSRISRFLEDVRRRQQTLALEDQMLLSAQFEGIIGRSPQMWEMFSRIRRVAPHFRTVLITGETGTGKDLVASALHRLSPVSSGHFVVLNCSAVVETLFESELFGHVKGAFTGAQHDKVGLFEHANNGTLFLDEIGDMPLATQAKLLRALQHQEVQRVGSLTARKVNVRVIAATHRDLRKAVTDNQFREDLYYRLSMIEIQVPRLRERLDDLPLLEAHFVAVFAKQFGKAVRGLTRRAQILLANQPWPGNVRELENVIGHGCMLTFAKTIDVADLPGYLRARTETLPPETARAPSDLEPRYCHCPEWLSPMATLEDHEKALLQDALARSMGNQSKAARLLRIGRDGLRYKMKKYGLL